MELQTLIAKGQPKFNPPPEQQGEEEDDDSIQNEVVPIKQDDEIEDDENQVENLNDDVETEQRNLIEIAEIRKKEQSIDAMIHQMELEFGASPAIAIEHSESTGFQSEEHQEEEEDEEEVLEEEEEQEAQEDGEDSNVSYEQSS